jgi:hypothetical protein
MNHVTKELGIPDRGEIGIGNEWSSGAVEEFTRVRIEQRAVGVKGPVLDGNRNFVVGFVWGKLVVLMRSGSRQNRPCAGSTVQHCVIAVGTTTDDVEAGWSGIYVQASQAERPATGPLREANPLGSFSVGVKEY